MRLKIQEITFDQKLWEFDFWVTPSIVDIRKTDRFQLEMNRIVEVLDTLSNADHQELDRARFSATLVDRVFSHLNGFHDPSKLFELFEFTNKFLTSFSALLFLVTGKSDNNNKCQFPIYLRNQLKWETIANIRAKGGKAHLKQEPTPKVIDSETFIHRISRIYVAGIQNPNDASLNDAAPQLLYEFVNFLLCDELSQSQLAAFLRHFRKSIELDEDVTLLLTPLVIFQVRGSVAASGGHEPEELLREKMTDWGMIRGVDFNTNDVILDVEAGRIKEAHEDTLEEGKNNSKTRAYDFALPFRTPTWHPMIFIQSQFYAGDSGSVSHKNVDQTDTSRKNATKLSAKAWPGSAAPKFLEYVDGAGYSASLNGDLKSLLRFSDTAGFFQVRSASIRLRRELQTLGFLTPLEIGHAVIRESGNESNVVKLLIQEGYKAEEIERTMNVSKETGLILQKNETLVINDDFMPIVRRHLLLDLIACEGKDHTSLIGLNGIALVPGYGPYHGVMLADLEVLIQKYFLSVWPTGFMTDLQELCEAGHVVLR